MDLGNIIIGLINNIPKQETIIFNIAIIIILSFIFSFIAKSLKQPLIPFYVLAGIIIGPLALGLIKNTELITILGEIGIAFLLFISGLEISIKKIKEANWKKIFFIGIFQVLLVFLFVLAFEKFLHLTILQSTYMGIILGFSSTMVVVKILVDKNELVTLHGRIMIGILLLQDLIAILAIVILTSQDFSWNFIVYSLIKLLFIVLIGILMQRYLVPKIFEYSADSKEMLFLSSIGILFSLILISYFLDLSLTIGAFIAGLCLANSTYKIEIESRLSPIKEFFSIIFFVVLGMQLVFQGIKENLILFIFLLIGTLIFKPFITMILVRLMGYRPKTSFFTAISLAQLSEFSLMLGVIALSANIFSKEIFSTIVLTTIITMTITPYLIKYKTPFYFLIRNPLKNIFKFFPLSEPLAHETKTDKSILLIGCHRIGSIILNKLKTKELNELLIIDHDPEIISGLMKKKISCIYGDISSPDLIESLNLKNLKTIISTVPGRDENLHLLKHISNKKVKVILTANRISEAIELYQKGANYVLLPKVIAGEKLHNLMEADEKNLSEIKKKQLDILKDIHKILY